MTALGYTQAYLHCYARIHNLKLMYALHAWHTRLQVHTQTQTYLLWNHGSASLRQSTPFGGQRDGAHCHELQTRHLHYLHRGKCWERS